MVFFGILFSLFAGMEAVEMKSEQKQFEKIAKNVFEPVESIHCASEMQSSAEEFIAQGNHEPIILPQYKDLWRKNSDLYGWIKIDDTKLDYPVMYTPDDPEKYLRLDFDGNSSLSGSIFLDDRCSDKSDNSILYGHNMKNGTMFGSILEYKDKSYWKAHPIIQFDTLFEERKYEIIAVFFDRVYNQDDTCFKYYNFIDAKDEAEFNDAIQCYREKSLYDTGISAQYGDRLLTLSTCAYHTKNGRFVIVARSAG